MQPRINTENKCTIIRIWPSSANSSAPETWMSPGHISLQTFFGGPNNNGHYISFWPGSKDYPCPAGCGKTEDHFHTREEDVEFCGQAHIDNTHIFESLDVTTMNAYFEKRIGEGVRWTLSACLLHLNNKNVANCCSLVYDILIKGGLNNLISREDRIVLGSNTAARTGGFVGIFGGAAVGFKLLNDYYSLQSARFIMEFLPRVYWVGQSEANNLTMQQNIFQQLHRVGQFSKSVIRNAYTYLPISENYHLLGLASLVGFATMATVFWGSKTTSNYLVIKPSDFLRFMPPAKLRDRNSANCFAFFNRENANNETDLKIQSSNHCKK